MSRSTNTSTPPSTKGTFHVPHDRRHSTPRQPHRHHPRLVHRVHPGWASSLLDDQKLGVGIAWALGEIPAAAVMILLVRQWIDADRREQRRLDRAADHAAAAGEDDDLARYNVFLASSARHEG